MRRPWLPVAAAAFAVGFLFAACGADNLDSPPPPVAPADIRQCQGFGQLMPNFVGAISTGRTENLRILIENQLLKPEREGDAPPINDILRAVFRTLDGFARKPAEPGAPAGQYCVPTAPLALNPDGGAPISVQQPPLTRANELCEMRRSLDLLVHQGKGIEAIKLIEPQLLAVLEYLIGQGKDRTPHYEVSAVLSKMATNSGNCRMTDGLDLVIAFTDYANTPEGKKLAADLNELAGKQSITGLLDPSALTEDGTVAIVRTLIPAIQSANPTDLENAFTSLPLPDQVKTDLRPALDDLKVIMGQPQLMNPMKASLNCYSKSDTNFELVRMIHRLALRDKLPEFGLTRLTAVLKGVQDVDQRGSLIFIVGALARAVRTDETAIDSTSKVLRTLLSTAPVTGQVRSNAELALPVATDLVKAGVIQEGICAIDTLIFGCAGGAQPACR